MFQSAPGLEAGRCHRRIQRQIREIKFQSAPGLEAGRSLGVSASLGAAEGFNPRPALRPGEACPPGRCHYLIL